MFGFIISSLVVVTTGCGRTASESTSSTSPISSSQPAADVSSTAQAEPSPSAMESDDQTDQSLISTGGIGKAQLGMTLGELKETLGAEAEFTVESPFITDFDAIAVREGGEVQYYILYLAGESFGDEDVIQGLFTDNPKFRTEAGVGPGTSIAQAEAAYGKATLSYNTQNESREYVRFEQQPSGNISFATGNANAEAAGYYQDSTEEYHETQEYQENALIQSVLVVCLTENCTPPTASN
ncbi:MAG: hypothetical protein Kow00121_00340 [Elainellaceae cyanobacterium]